MSHYIKQIEQLVDLQKVDDVLHSIRMEIKNAPLEVEALTAKFNDIEEQRVKIADKLTHLQDQQKRLAMDIDDDSMRIKKSKSKLMQVGNTKEYHAMMREMDTMEKINRTREEEKLALLEEMQTQSKALEEIESSWHVIKADLESRQAGLDERLGKARAKLEEMEHLRVTTSAGVPQPVFMRYEFIRHRLDHPVIVSVSEGICSGCHISIPPQAFIELQRGQHIASCPNCQRLIYWSEHFTPNDSAEPGSRD